MGQLGREAELRTVRSSECRISCGRTLGVKARIFCREESEDVLGMLASCSICFVLLRVPSWLG